MQDWLREQIDVGTLNATDYSAKEFKNYDIKSIMIC